MPFVETRLISPTTLTTSASSALYTVPTGYSAIIKQLVVTNITGTAATFTFYIGTASAGNALFSGTSVAANDTVVINLSQVLTTGETLRALASSNSALNLTVSGVINDGPLASTATVIVDNAVTTNKIAAGAVTTAKIADGAIVTVDIADGAVTQAKLSTDIPLSGFRNVIINGDMRIAQRGTSTASITTAGYYTCDRWRTDILVAGTWTQTQSTDAPAGFGNSLKMQCTTASASPVLAFIQTRFEGQDLQRFAKGTASAKSFSLSFWVKAFQTGTYICELYDYDNTRQCSKSYTVNTSGTWEYKTITFPSDTTGAFDNDNGASLTVNFWLAASSLFMSGTLNTSWGAVVQANEAVGQTNVASSTSNYFQITGVQLEANPQPTPFEQRPIGVELALCQRYYQRLTYQTTNYFAIGQVYPTNNAYAVIDLPTTLRIAPSSITVSGTTFALDSGGVGRGITVAMANATTGNIGINATGSFNLTNGHAALLAFSTAPNYIELNGTEL